MPIATFRGEKSTAEIADKLFVSLTPRQREMAEAALLKANPQLREIDSVREGSILRVPDIPELRPKTNRSLDNPDAQIARDVSEALRDYNSRLGARAEQASADNKAQVALLKSAAFKRTLGNVPELQELAAQVGKALDARARTVSDRQQAAEQAIKQLLKDLGKGFG